MTSLRDDKGSFLSKTLMAKGSLAVRETVGTKDLYTLEVEESGGAERFLKQREMALAKGAIEEYAPNCKGCSMARIDSERIRNPMDLTMTLSVRIRCDDSQCLPAMRAARGGRPPSAAAAFTGGIAPSDHRKYITMYGDCYDDLPFKESDTHTYTYNADDFYANDANESVNVGLIANFLNNLKEAKKREEEELAEIEAMADTLTFPDEPKGDDVGTW